MCYVDKLDYFKEVKLDYFKEVKLDYFKEVKTGQILYFFIGLNELYFNCIGA